MNTRQRGTAAGIAIILVAVFGLYLYGVGQEEQADQNQQQAEQAQEQADDAQGLVTAVVAACDKPTQRKQLRELGVCEEAIEQAQQAREDDIEPVLIPGPQGERGPAPTATQVRAAVAAYCASTNCDGVDGEDVTQQQVRAAVRTYCDAGACRGEKGDKGDTGEPGPAATDTQIAEAVAIYCADGKCRGPEGPTGPSGPRGLSCVEELGLEECRGPRGPAGPAGADGKDGQDGTAVPGTYSCPEGEVIAAITVHQDGTITLDCRRAPLTGPGSGGSTQ